MGLFQRKPKSSAPDLSAAVAALPAVDLPHGSRMGVAGFFYYQEAIQRALDGAASEPPPGIAVDPKVDGHHIAGWISAVLVAEDNEHDPFAVAIYAAGGGKIGHIDRKHSEAWRRVLAEYVNPRGGEVGRCPAYVYLENGTGPTLGVRLRVSTAAYVLRNLDEDA
jgi:hypothetical protein